MLSTRWEQGRTARAHLLEEQRERRLDEHVAEPLEPLLAIRERPGLAIIAHVRLAEKPEPRDGRPDHQHNAAVSEVCERVPR